ncbi:hypothetical protein IJ596_08265 [bacterium]|nr:hypothetical protein [bacterium]
MFELNKFKITTLCFILMFIFVIAAIYSNTKDIVKDKNGQSNSYQSSYNYPEQRSNRNNVNNSTINNLSNRISSLEERMSELPYDNPQQDKFNCTIQGFMSGDILVPVSESESLKEAKDNGKELVMLCRFE